MKAEVALSASARLGESPAWDADDSSLLWVDILGGEIHRFDSHAGDRVVACFESSVGSVAPRRDRGVVAAVGGDVLLLDACGREESRVTVETRRNTRLNNGVCDAQGRFWTGSMDVDERPGRGSLYVVTPDLQAQRVFGDIGVSNGTAWVNEGATMLYVDSLAHRIDRCEIVDGLPADRRPFVEIATELGLPDGLTVDAEEGIWVALFGGGALHRYSAGGKLEEVLVVPTPYVTSCGFGGIGLEDLFITSAKEPLGAGDSEGGSMAGHLFVVRPGVAGRPTETFWG